MGPPNDAGGGGHTVRLAGWSSVHVAGSWAPGEGRVRSASPAWGRARGGWNRILCAAPKKAVKATGNQDIPLVVTDAGKGG